MNREPTPVVFITGAAGTGKSTVAELLSDRWTTTHLDFDEVTRPVVDLALVEHPEWDEATCLQQVKPLRYSKFFADIETLLAGRDAPEILVASAPMTGYLADPSAWGPVEVRIREVGGVPIVIWLHVDEEIRQARVATRGSTRDLGVEESQRAPSPPKITQVPVSAEASPEEVADRISVELQKIFGKP
ncbi:MAG: hypothetical protein RJB01_1351 [Actinomycetota bacterium]